MQCLFFYLKKFTEKNSEICAVKYLYDNNELKVSFSDHHHLLKYLGPAVKLLMCPAMEKKHSAATLVPRNLLISKMVYVCQSFQKKEGMKQIIFFT